ncbi:DUF4350 domain-containing protein [Flavobacterium rhizosphaerae]|uniref:DUF4350 domain-containing protein n=1 Tax=Flavobacterium rhizosphaerae TaxID=3163298 RepID=A0ABW8YZJ6_9FLAO
MSRKLLIGIIISSVVLFVLIIIASALSPKDIDWSRTYNVNDKIPFGLYVFNNEAEGLFKNHDITKFSSSPYEFLDAHYNYDTRKYEAGSILKVSGNNTLDPSSVQELLYYADYGNTVMLSMEHMPQKLLDTLGLRIKYEQPADSVQLTVKNNKARKFWFKEGIVPRYFDSISQNNDSITILGYETFKGVKKPDFIEVRFGDGRILLHTQPIAFTNFYLLKNNYYQYAEEVTSKIPVGKLFWQNIDDEEMEDRSSLRYIMQQPALRAAWRLGLLGLLIFILFNAKRKQRVVPIVSPLLNTTISFAKTIGNLYYQERNHHTIIEKKIIYFLEYVRNEYLIDTYSLDDGFIQKLHQKTGKPVDDIQKAVNLIKKHRHALNSTEADVVEINNAIEKLRL